MQNLHKDHPHVQSQRLWKAHKRGWAMILVLLMAVTSLVKENATHLQLNLLGAGTPQHAAFDGTVQPLAEVPNWLEATSDERNMTFNQFPQSKLVDLPTYNNARLTEDTSALEWGDPYDDHTRQMKLTYTVPYAANYHLDDWREGAGSHPGVDIKALNGTPVFAIANGIAERVTYSNAGFGNLIVLRHNNVPFLEDSNRTTTLHSGYAHLQDIFVTDGEIVTKGQMIGTVGHTGTATTDHLHFQIDREEAPWHLYWPFTGAEARAQGYSFWNAVNEGLNLKNVYEKTLHPLAYSQKYLDPEATYGAAPEIADPVVTDPAITDDNVIIDDEVVVAVDPDPTSPVPDVVPPALNENAFQNIEVDYEPFLLVNDQRLMTVSLVNELGEPVHNAQFNANIKIEVENPDVVDIGPLELTWTTMMNGTYDVRVVGRKPGKTNFSITFLGHTFFTGAFEVPMDREPLDSFALETDRIFFLGKPETVVIVALNANRERVTNFDLRIPLKLEVVQGQGFFSKEALIDDDFDRGMAVVEFTSTSDEQVILKASHPDYEDSSALLSTSLFLDLEETHAYYSAIDYLKSQGIIQGYEDDTFRPEQAVSRVEALKFIFSGLKKEVVAGVKLNFPDTEADAWYASYVATAQRDGIVKGYPDGYFRPSNKVNRVEFMKMLISAMGTDVDPVVMANPYADVHYLEWYAPYAQFVKETNISPWNGTSLHGGEAMTRGEVAEMLYRLLALRENEVEKYSRTLVLN